jgi:Sec-independent protein translocase protein TatA
MKALVAIAVIAGLSSTAAYADCPYPSGPKKIPDGGKATLDQMMDMKKAVKQYDDDTNAYLGCIQKEHDEALAALGDKATDKQKADLDRVETDRHNSAVAQLQSVADKFNEQVRAYKAKNPGK